MAKRCSVSFRPGSIVEAHGLIHAARLNGKRGTVNGRLQNDRIGVDFPTPDGTKALRPENLVALENAGIDNSLLFPVVCESLESRHEAITVNVLSLSGDIFCSPQALSLSNSVQSLRASIGRAAGVHPLGLKLLLDSVEIRSGSLATAGLRNGATVTALISPVSQALQILEKLGGDEDSVRLPESEVTVAFQRIESTCAASEPLPDELAQWVQALLLHGRCLRLTVTHKHAAMASKKFTIDAEGLAGPAGEQRGPFHSPGVLFFCHGDGGGRSYTFFSYHFWWVDITGARGHQGAVYHTICEDQRNTCKDRPPSLEFLSDDSQWTNRRYKLSCSYLAPSLTDFFSRWAENGCSPTLEQMAIPSESD